MSSRYIRLAESELDAAPTQSRRLLLIGKLAFHYARLGNQIKVEEFATELRQSLLNSESSVGEAICWINLAEGIILHYNSRILESRAKWERGRALAESLGSRQLQAIAGAWFAFSHYLSEQPVMLVRHGTLAIDRTDIGNYSAISRISLTIALCLHYVGDVSAAQEWYTRCRLAAVNEGDEASLAALIHSMAWMRASTERVHQIAGDRRSTEGLVLIKSETVESYERLVGAKNLPALTPLLSAQEKILEGNYSAAIALIEMHTTDAGKQGFGRLTPGLLADQAYCLANLGRSAEAEVVAVHARQQSCEDLHSDDLVILHSTLYKTFSVLRNDELAEHHSEAMLNAIKKLRSFREELTGATKELVDRATANQSYDLV